MRVILPVFFVYILALIVYYSVYSLFIPQYDSAIYIMCSCIQVYKYVK